MKITVDGHTLEGTPEELKELFTLMGAEFPIKKTDKVEEPTEETFEHDGKQLRKVDRKCKTGDYVRFPDLNQDGTINEKLYPVIKDNMYLDEDGQLLGVYGWEGICPNPEIFEVIEESTPTFREGDRVKVLADGEDGDIKAGEVGVIDDINEDALRRDDQYYIGVDTDDDYDYFRPQDLEKVTEEDYVPSEGDIVVITANTNFSCNKVGDIGKVGNVDMSDDTAEVEVKGRGGNGNWTKFSEMRPATDEEKAQYEREVKTGRKPGEFKKGDIVRLTEFRGGHSKGTIAEVGDYTDSDEDCVYIHTEEKRSAAMIDYLELIAPVESRVDV